MYDDEAVHDWMQQVMEYQGLCRDKDWSIERLTKMIETYQWGTEGICPACSATVTDGRHSKTCPVWLWLDGRILKGTERET